MILNDNDLITWQKQKHKKDVNNFFNIALNVEENTKEDKFPAWTRQWKSQVHMDGLPITAQTTHKQHIQNITAANSNKHIGVLHLTTISRPWSNSVL